MASSGPRILLFGSTGSGKSSLLGALAQASATQQSLLKGTLSESDGRLVELKKKTYESSPDPTGEVTAYDIHLEPAEGVGAQADAILVDVGGDSAKEMLQSKHPFLDSHPMKRTILDADMLILTVDASLTGKQLAEEFQQFARWLLDFHEARGRRTEVGELPVYLVLTKCDMLAKPNDTFSMWMQRIEEGKRRIDQKFREYLKKQGTGFGSIDLRLWATAIRRPALTDRPAKAHEPYAVAELFRQCLPSATEYLERRQTSQYRLHNIVIGLTSIVAILGLVVAGLWEYQPESKGFVLEERVQAAMPKKEEDRLRTSVKNLETRHKMLIEIEQDPGFWSLVSEKKERVTRYRQELDQYLQLYQESQTKLKRPDLAKNEEEYTEFKKNVDAFKLPEQHAKDWENSKLGLRMKQLRAEYEQVATELKHEEAWLRDQIKMSKKTLKEGYQLNSKLLESQKLEPLEAELWDIAYRDRIQPKPRMPREDYIGSTRVKYEDLEKFQQIREPQQNWRELKEELRSIAATIQKRLKAGF